MAIMGRITAGLLTLAATSLAGNAVRSTAGAVLKNAVSSALHGGSQGQGPRQECGASNPLVDAVRELLSEDVQRRGKSSCSRRSSRAATGKASAGAAKLREERARALEAMLDSVVSLTPGRMRMRHHAFSDATANQSLSDKLAATDKFTSISFTPGTGSVLLQYDTAKVPLTRFLEAALPLGYHILHN